MTKVVSLALAMVFVFNVPNALAASTPTNTTPADAPLETTQPERWNNVNWFTREHPEPATFSVTATGEAYGTTTTGIPFSQVYVPNEQQIRVQKFIIEDHYHYIIFGTIVYSDEELQNILAQGM